MDPFQIRATARFGSEVIARVSSAAVKAGALHHDDGLNQKKQKTAEPPDAEDEPQNQTSPTGDRLKTKNFSLQHVGSM